MSVPVAPKACTALPLILYRGGDKNGVWMHYNEAEAAQKLGVSIKDLRVGVEYGMFPKPAHRSGFIDYWHQIHIANCVTENYGDEYKPNVVSGAVHQFAADHPTYDQTKCVPFSEITENIVENFNRYGATRTRSEVDDRLTIGTVPHTMFNTMFAAFMAGRFPSVHFERIETEKAPVKPRDKTPIVPPDTVTAQANAQVNASLPPKPKPEPAPVAMDEPLPTLNVRLDADTLLLEFQSELKAIMDESTIKIIEVYSRAFKYQLNNRTPAINA